MFIVSLMFRSYLGGEQAGTRSRWMQTAQMITFNECEEAAASVAVQISDKCVLYHMAKFSHLVESCHVLVKAETLNSQSFISDPRPSSDAIEMHWR